MSRFWGVFFIDTSSADIAEQAFSKMARMCKVGESMEAFKSYLTNSLEPWLLILDNADDPSLDVARFFPVGNRGTIIVTSRNPECRCHATAGSRKLHEMESDEAITLLLRSGDLNSEDEDLRGLALPIVQTLGYLALAVNHAGASIRQNICSLDDYRDKYTRHRKKLLSSRPAQAGSDYKYTVYTTWEISVDSIKELAKDATNSTAVNALELLTLFGFCHFDDITEGMFRSAWTNFARTKGYPWWASNMLGMIRDRRPLKWDSIAFREAIQLLSSYSLIHVSEPNSRISLHLLVHTWIRDSLSEEMQLRWWNIAVSTLALAEDPLQSYHLQLQLKVHLRHCIGVGQMDDLFLEDEASLDRVAILSLISSVHLIHPYKDALKISERALEYSTKTFGHQCYSTCLLSYRLAQVFNLLSEYQKTSDLLQDKVDISIRVVGPTNDVTLGISSELSRAYRLSGRMQEALDLVRRTLAVCEESQDESDEAYLEALGDVAEVYSKLGRHEEAVDLFKKLLAKRKELFNEDDVNIMSSEVHLANAYSRSEQHQAAFETLKSTLRKCSNHLGEDHIITLFVMVWIAVEYGHLGQPEKGIPLIVKTLEVGSRTGVPDAHLDTWKRRLKSLQSRTVNTSPPLPHLEGEEVSSSRRWKFWPKTRPRIDESSS